MVMYGCRGPRRSAASVHGVCRRSGAVLSRARYRRQQAAGRLRTPAAEASANRSRESRRNGPMLRYTVEVFAQAPRIQLFKPQDDLRFGPTPLLSADPPGNDEHRHASGVPHVRRWISAICSAGSRTDPRTRNSSEPASTAVPSRARSPDRNDTLLYTRLPDENHRSPQPGFG